MIKKTKPKYLKPTMQVFEIKQSLHLLQASGEPRDPWEND